MGVVACKLPNGLTIDHKGETVTLTGSNDANAVSGYGLTHDVDIDWFMDWATGPARDFPPVARNLIFVAGNSANAGDQAREQAGERSGLEGIDPANPAPGIEPTEEQKKELEKTQGAAKPPGK